MNKQEFLGELRPLPEGLTGGIEVKDLTVQEFPGVALVRFLADEWESVFGQRLTTQYRVTDIYRREGEDWKLVGRSVELRDGKLYGGRDPKKLRPFVPLTPDAFVLSGTLGEWMFVAEMGRAVRILNLRKFQPLVWTRVGEVL